MRVLSPKSSKSSKSSKSAIRRGLASLVVAVSLPAAAAPAAGLPALAADGNAIGVSGISSGGYMAVQFQVAHSARVAGAGIVAGGPYYCARGSTFRALNHCMTPSSWFAPPTLVQTEETIDTVAKAGRIDPPDRLRDDRVWLLSGGADKTVERPVMDALAAYFKARLPVDAFKYVQPPTAGHAMPSAVDAEANACPTSDPPFINKCPDPDGAGSLDAPGELLQHLAGTTQLNAPGASTSPAVAFDQRPFITGKPIDASLADEGYVFVPASCRSGGCKIHVAFHGCRQSAKQIGTRFVDKAGYNRWAETNRIIVLYPQTDARSGFAAGSWTWLYNPKGCWDWWGYSGSEYHTQKGKQVEAVRKMVDRLAAPLTR